MFLNLMGPILIYILVLYKLGNCWSDICISITKKYTFIKQPVGASQGFEADQC